MIHPQLYSIGEVASLFHLSVSSLRHYETLGLITPEYIDPATGYRYFSTRQFEPLNTIRYLRALDMPLREIADFLQNRDVETIEEKLRTQKAALELKQRELKLIQRKVDTRLRQLREVQRAPLGTIELITAPACRLFWVEATLTAQDYTDLELSTSKLVAAQSEALVFLGKVGFSVSREHLEAGLFEQYDGTFLVLDSADRVKGETLTLPETRCVRVRFHGHHRQAPEQYRRLLGFIAESGLRVAGFSREIALIDYGFTNDTEKFITEISIPVENA